MKSHLIELSERTQGHIRHYGFIHIARFYLNHWDCITGSSHAYITSHNTSIRFSSIYLECDRGFHHITRIHINDHRIEYDAIGSELIFWRFNFSKNIQSNIDKFIGRCRFEHLRIKRSIINSIFSIPKKRNRINMLGILHILRRIHNRRSCTSSIGISLCFQWFKFRARNAKLHLQISVRMLMPIENFFQIAASSHYFGDILTHIPITASDCLNQFVILNLQIGRNSIKLRSNHPTYGIQTPGSISIID